MAAIVNDVSERTQEMLGEMLSYVEATRNALVAAQVHCKTWPDGGVYPDARAMHPMRSILPVWMARVNEIMKVIGSHNLLAVASHARGHCNPAPKEVPALGGKGGDRSCAGVPC